MPFYILFFTVNEGFPITFFTQKLLLFVIGLVQTSQILQAYVYAASYTFQGPYAFTFNFHICYSRIYLPKRL